MILQGEEVIAVCRRHWTRYIIPGMVAAFFGVGIIVEVLAWALYGDAFELDIFIMCAAFVLAAVLYIYIDRKYTYIALTKTYLVARTGVFMPRSYSTVRSKPHDIWLLYTLSGRIFGYYTVTIKNSYSGEVVFTVKHMSKTQAYALSTQNITVYER